MAVYHFTIHAYRSWGPGHPRGFVKPGSGYLPPDPKLARDYDDRANFPPVRFDTPELQEILILGSIDACRRRGWRCHGVGTDPTHFHTVLSWTGFIPWQRVRQQLKNALSYLLGRSTGRTGQRWFVTEGSRKRVVDRPHFDYLLDTYLPDHRGLFWREEWPLPEDPFGILTPDQW